MITVIKKYLILSIGLMALTLITIYSFLGADQPTVPSPQAVNGSVDLSAWDFMQQGPVSLNGQWEFYGQQLLAPENFQPNSTATKPHLTGYITVPGDWQSQFSAPPVSNINYATYRLTVKILPTKLTMGLKTGSIRSAHSLIVNGMERGHNGVVATNKDDFVSYNVPYVTFFNTDNDNIEIIVQVANYNYPSAGIALPILFGNQQDILAKENYLARFELILFAAIFTIGIYHLGIFLFHKKQYTALLFGLYCIFVAITELSHDQKLIYQFFPWIEFELLYKAKTICIAASMVTITLFLKEELQIFFPNRIKNSINIVYGSYILSVIFLPISYFSLIENYFVGLQMLLYSYFIILLSTALYKQRDNPSESIELQVLIIAFSCVVLSYADALLYLYAFKANRLIWFFGATTWVFSFSFLLVFRFRTAYIAIQNMSNELLELNIMKDKFLLITSHEIKTPLQGIINIAQSVLTESSCNITLQQSKNIRLIIDISTRLSHMANDLLDVVKLKIGTLTLHPVNVDVYSSVNTLLTVFRSISRNSTIELVNEIDPNTPYVWADENRGAQILYNLIDNALKFTTEGKVTISAKQHQDMLHVSIEDSGSGIPTEEQERIFEPYKRTSFGIDREYTSDTGGLAITKSLLSLMGCEIWIEWSIPGKGTKFSFSLPISTSNDTVTTLTPSEELIASHDKFLTPLLDTSQQELSRQHPFTILAVDDEPTNLQIILNVFILENINILTANSGIEALELLEQYPYIDLVLLDVMMPKLSGYEVCKKIRETYSLFELPIIMFTTHNTIEDIITGFEVGANDFITKPFTSKVLKVRTKNLLELKQSAESAIRFEMAFLQAQIKPHFFYNVLNTITSFCYTDSAKAGQLLAEFSNYLRRSFDIQDNTKFILLANELDLVKSYVAIEQARFGSRLSVMYDIDNELLQYYLPPLLIQPLVENAVRHGLLKRIAGGEVMIRINACNDNLTIEIIDNGIGISPEKIATLFKIDNHKKGVSLCNINLRLGRFFGRQLNITSNSEQGTTVSMTLPLITAPTSHHSKLMWSNHFKEQN